MNAIHFPRTLRDVEEMKFLVSEGLTIKQVFAKMTDPHWRSDVIEERGHLFCAQCDQIISLNYCVECGQNLPALLPTSFDLIPVKSESRTLLMATATKLIRAYIRPELTLTFVQWLNLNQCSPPMEVIAVEMIFNEVAAREIKRWNSP